MADIGIDPGIILPVVSRLTQALLDAGYPIQFVNDNGDGTYTITLTSEGTALQKIEADTFAATYVDMPKVAVPIPTILAAFNALTAEQQQKVIAACCAVCIYEFPDIAALVNVNISGEAPIV